MNKQELVDRVAAATDTPRATVTKVLDGVLETVMQAVHEGDTVQLIGFGAFSAVDRAARTGRNPATGEPLEIKASRSAKFAVGKAFKDALNT